MIEIPHVGPVYYHRVEGDQEINVIPLTFGRARIVVGPVGADWWSHGY